VVVLWDKYIGLFPALTHMRVHIRIERLDPAQKATPPPSSSSSAQLPSGYPPAENMAARFLRNLTGGTADVVTNLEIVGLESLRRRFDMHWEMIEDKVHQVVRLIIHRHLDQNDSFMPISKMQYGIVFSKTSKKIAKKKAEAIRQEILAIFLKDAAFKDSLGIDVSATRYISKATSEKMIDMVYREEKKAGAAPLYFRASPLEANACAAGQSNAHMRPPLLLDESGQGILPPNIEYRYRAIYDQGSGKVTAQRYMYYLPTSAGGALYEYDVLPEQADDDMYLRLDTDMLNVVADRLRNKAHVGHTKETNPKLICPVNYRTLSDPRTRGIYARTLRSLEKDTPFQHLGFEILHMPRALYGPALQDPLSSLTRFSPYVVVRCAAIDAFPEEGYREAGAMGVSVFCASLSRLPSEATQVKLQRFVKAANKYKLRSYAFGLDTEALCDDAEIAGFSCLCGDGVLKKHPV